MPFWWVDTCSDSAAGNTGPPQGRLSTRTKLWRKFHHAVEEQRNATLDSTADGESKRTSNSLVLAACSKLLFKCLHTCYRVMQMKAMDQFRERIETNVSLLKLAFHVQTGLLWRCMGRRDVVTSQPSIWRRTCRKDNKAIYKSNLHSVTFCNYFLSRAKKKEISSQVFSHCCAWGTISRQQFA